MIDFTTPRGKNNQSSALRQGSATVPANNAPASETTNLNATQKLVVLLKQLPNNSQLAATVKSSQLLSQQQLQFLQRHNAQASNSLAQALANSSAKVPSPAATPAGHTTNSPASTLPSSTISASTTSASTTPANIYNNAAQLNAIPGKALAPTSLYLNQLTVNTGSGSSQTISTLTQTALQHNTNLLISHNNGKLVFKTTTEHNLQTALQNNIKQVLPQQQPLAQLQQFAHKLQQLPQTIQNSLFNKTLQQNLSQLTHFSHSQQSLSSASDIKTALQNTTISTRAIPGSSKNGLAPLLTQIQTVLTKGLELNSVNSGSNATQSSTVKAEVLLKEVERFIQRSLQPSIQTSIQNSPLPTNTTHTSLTSSAPNTTQTTLIQNTSSALLQLLGLPVTSTVDNTALAQQQLAHISKAIEQQLKQAVEKAQARLQYNQLRSIGLDSVQREGGVNFLQAFHSELSLRFADQILPLNLSIREEAYFQDENEQQENSEKSDDKQSRRRWVVFMSFDLPGGEALHTQLAIVDSTVSATLWSESSRLCQQARESINSLRDKFLAQGLNVDELNCVQGKPPQQESNLAYNLVDIKT